MIEPILLTLLTALLEATNADRVVWQREEGAFLLTGSQATVRIEEPGFWNRFALINAYGYEVKSIATPSDDAAFDAGLRALIDAIEQASFRRAAAAAAREGQRVIARDTVIAALLADLEERYPRT